MKQLEGKKVTQVGLGDDFVIALGLTLPQHEYAKLAAQNGVLKQKTVSNKDQDAVGRPNIRRIKSGNSTKKQINYSEVMQSSQA